LRTSKPRAKLSTCAVRLSFLHCPGTRTQVNGDAPEPLLQGSAAYRQQREVLKRRAMIALGPSSNQKGEIAMFFLSEGFTFRNFLTDAFAVFMFVLWFWLLVTVIGDLFRRHDISGWGKAIWVIALIVFPYLAIFAYLITQSKGMAERTSQQAQQAREELRRVVGFSVADEIEKLDRLKKSGSISETEYAKLRAKLI
jgi:hypothetical protein